MVTLVGMLSPAPQAPSGEALPISEDARTRLGQFLDQLTELVMPLASVDTRAELTRSLDRNAPEYLHLKNTVGRLIMDALTPEAFARFDSQSYDQMAGLVAAGGAMLGPDDREALTDVIESYRDMVQGVLDGLATSPGATLDVLVECSPALQRADMCLSATMLVLTGKANRWHPNSLRLLTRAARNYMLQVEDIFLVHDRELAERLATRGPTVSLDEVKRQVGLPL